jgi:selenide,water dikinase
MAELAQVLRPLLPSNDPRVLVDATTGDDAAVYRLTPARALVVTVDFFSPVVDDPRDFGRIAAANALSDLYAMGARPLFALNLFAFPRAHLSEGWAEEILAGGAEVAAQAQIPVLGGHSIDDPEPKYGMVAVGQAHPDRLVTNAAGRPGDVLILTKPLGTGVITTALKADAAPPSVLARAVDSMATLNAGASEVMVRLGVRCATDVTGFGLLGHLRAVARASGLSARIEASKVPLLEGARELAAAGHVPGGTKRNSRDLDADLEMGHGVDPVTRLLLCDAQTSGGLLMAVPASKVAAVESRLAPVAPVVARIGHLSGGPAGRIQVT